MHGSQELEHQIRLGPYDKPIMNLALDFLLKSGPYTKSRSPQIR